MSSQKSNPKTYPQLSGDRADQPCHLHSLKRLVVRLQASSIEILPGTSKQTTYTATALLALLNLAFRGLAPSALKGGTSLLLKMIGDRFFDDQQFQSRLRADDTALAAHCCSFLAESTESLSPDQCRRLVEALAESIGRAQSAGLSAPRRQGKNSPTGSDLIPAIAGDNLAAGWAHEYLAQNACASQLARTQFFTPSWIAAYLCAEAIGARESFTLLDPACGAGHLLVQALEQALDQAAKNDSSITTSEKLAELFSRSLFGLDVDPGLLNLAAFSLYLCARDKLQESRPSASQNGNEAFTNLPLPRLYLLEGPLGTLDLGKMQTVHDINGQQVSASLLPAKFDAVVMNPPYLSTRTMDDTTAAYLRDHFPGCSGDLYTAFMQLAMRLLKDGGRLSTVVQQSFLSISRYRKFRLDLLQQARLISCVQLGTGVFPSRPGEKVNNAIITLQKLETSNAASVSADHLIRYLRLQGKKDHELVRAEGLVNYPHESIRQDAALKLIMSLAGQPFAFHCPGEIAEIFQSQPSLASLKDDFVLTNGLFTCDNNRFVKLASAVDAGESNEFVPYDKGGGKKWYHETPYLLHWGKDGQAIRDFRVQRGQSRSLPGESFYFHPGITYSYIGTKGFSARLLSRGAIFDIASSAVFSLKHDLNYVLGFFNSALVAYLLSILNPTINFQIGDLRKLPFKAPDAELETIIAALAGEAVAIVQTLEPRINSGGTSREIESRERESREMNSSTGQRQRAEMVTREKEIQEQIDALIFDHYAVSQRSREAILDDAWVKRGRRPII